MKQYTGCVYQEGESKRGRWTAEVQIGAVKIRYRHQQEREVREWIEAVRAGRISPRMNTLDWRDRLTQRELGNTRREQRKKRINIKDMTLKGLYDQWASVPANAKLAAAYRLIAANLIREYGDRDLLWFTKRNAATCVISFRGDENRARTASLLLTMLNYGASVGFCPMPKYDISSIRESGGVPTTALPDEAPEASPDGEVNLGGRPKVPVVQLNPDTLQVIQRFDGFCDASEATGINRKSLCSAANQGRRCRGFYFVREDRLAGFLESKRRKQAKAKPGAEPETAEVTANKAAKNAVKEETISAAAEAVGSPESERLGQDAADPARENPSPLSDFSDEQLRQELVRRGWRGRLYICLDFHQDEPKNI